MIKKDLKILSQGIDKLQEGFDSFPDTINIENEERLLEVILDVATKLQNNFPYFQANYAGQMLKPPHAIARLSYMLSLYINPNNHALDGGRASSEMEKDVIVQIAQMFNWDACLGHLTSGGTVANLEALWVSGRIHPGKAIVASEMSHYTHERISGVLKLPFQKIKCDQKGKMDLIHLEQEISKGEVGTVVVTLGTTGIGSVDPLTQVLKLQTKYANSHPFRIHVDAAYGGYFGLVSDLKPQASEEYKGLKHVDSIVIDPHKHGLQPYGCGCVIFKDPEVGKYYLHDSPYTYFSSEELHLGEITLECSRPGASAVALWATMKMFPLQKGGEFASNLTSSILAARKLALKIRKDDRFMLLLEPELDIVVWAPRGKSLSSVSKSSQNIFTSLAKNHNLHLALIKIPLHLLDARWEDCEKDQETLTCLRSCLMKPEHLEFVEDMWNMVQNSTWN